jgi:hypothetical protein
MYMEYSLCRRVILYIIIIIIVIYACRYLFVIVVHGWYTLFVASDHR